MRIFLTGATGYIGAAVLDALVRGGHDVTALVCDNEKARRVAKRWISWCAAPPARARGLTPTLHSVAGNAARLVEEWRESRN